MSTKVRYVHSKTKCPKSSYHIYVSRLRGAIRISWTCYHNIIVEIAVNFMQKSVSPDQKLNFEASDPGLHSLPVVLNVKVTLT